MKPHAESSNPLMVALVTLIHILSSANVFFAGAATDRPDVGRYDRLALAGWPVWLGNAVWWLGCTGEFRHAGVTLVAWIEGVSLRWSAALEVVQPFHAGTVFCCQQFAGGRIRASGSST